MELLLGADGFAFALGAGVAAVGLQDARLEAVGEVRLQHVDQPLLVRLAGDGEEDFQPPVEVAAHPVRAG